MSISIIRKILAKKNESDFTKAGFLSGIFAGIIIGIFTFGIYIINKKKYFEEIDSIKNIVQFPVPNETIWIISIILTPPVIVIIYSIVGIILGSLFKTFEGKNWLIIIFSFLIGIIWGTITNLPVSKIFIIIINILSWLLFGIIFILLTYRKKGK